MRPVLVALLAGMSIVAVAPASALAGAGADGEYQPPNLGPGNGGPRGDFDLSDEFDQSAPSTNAAPAVQPGAPTATTPVDPAAAARAERKARRKARRQRELKLAQRRVAKAAEAVSEDFGLTGLPRPGSKGGTDTAADISRTAFESGGSGPLPMVAGVLLLLTGVGLVARGRRPRRTQV